MASLITLQVPAMTRPGTSPRFTPTARSGMGGSTKKFVNRTKLPLRLHARRCKVARPPARDRRRRRDSRPCCGAIPTPSFLRGVSLGEVRPIRRRVVSAGLAARFGRAHDGDDLDVRGLSVAERTTFDCAVLKASQLGRASMSFARARVQVVVRVRGGALNAGIEDDVLARRVEPSRRQTPLVAALAARDSNVGRDLTPITCDTVDADANEPRVRVARRASGRRARRIAGGNAALERVRERLLRAPRGWALRCAPRGRCRCAERTQATTDSWTIGAREIGVVAQARAGVREFARAMSASAKADTIDGHTSARRDLPRRTNPRGMLRGHRGVRRSRGDEDAKGAVLRIDLRVGEARAWTWALRRHVVGSRCQARMAVRGKAG